MNRPKILLLAFSCRPDGSSESYVGYKWAEQVSRFADVTIATAGASFPLKSGVVAPVCRRFRFSNRLLRLINEEMKLDYFWYNDCVRRQFRKTPENFDVVHQVTPVAPRYPCALAHRARRFVLGPIGGGLRVPPAFRAEVEGLEPWFYKLRLMDGLRLRFDLFLRRTYGAADRILVAGAYMLKVLPSAHHHRCRVMLDVGVDSCQQRVPPRKPKDNKTPIELLYIGRPVPYKGLIYALRALDAVPPEKRDRLRLTVVGDRGEGRYEAVCKQYVADRNLGGVVTFAGFRPKEQVQPFYQRADLFIFPSLAEAGGTVVLEAMGHGLPVLTVDQGGPGEVVTPEAGFVLPARTPEQLVQAIADVLQQVVANPAQLIEKGIVARRLVEARYDWSVKGQALRKIYEELLGHAVPDEDTHACPCSAR